MKKIAAIVLALLCLLPAAAMAAEECDTEAMDYVREKGLVDSGIDPEGVVSRGMAVAMLWRLEGMPAVGYAMQFEDVAEDAWYAEAVRWAAAEGIVEGCSDSAFCPDEEITREQLAVIIYRYEQSKGGGFTGMWMFLLNFEDRAEVSDWAYEALCWTTMKGVVEGRSEGILAPKGGIKLCEAARIMMNYLEL